MKQRTPRVWLFTDPRQGDALWAAIARLPRDAGVVFRHYDAPDRAALGQRVRAAVRRRGGAFIVAGSARDARAMRADGQHRARWVRGGWAPGLRTASAHDLPGLRAAERRGADLVFLSPVFATASHPGKRPLGRVRLGAMVQHARMPVAVLGGMSPARFRSVVPLGAVGWGAVDVWIRPGTRSAASPMEDSGHVSVSVGVGVSV